MYHVWKRTSQVHLWKELGKELLPKTIWGLQFEVLCRFVTAFSRMILILSSFVYYSPMFTQTLNEISFLCRVMFMGLLVFRLMCLIVLWTRLSECSNPVKYWQNLFLDYECCKYVHTFLIFLDNVTLTNDTVQQIGTSIVFRLLVLLYYWLCRSRCADR